MRVRAVLGSIFASTAVLVVGWQAGAVVLAPDATAAAQPEAASATSADGTGSSAESSQATAAPESATAPTVAPTAASDSDASAADSSAAAAPSVADGTFTGSTVDTRFGSVQVSVTIAGGAITDVTALKLTDHESRSVQISNRAAPLLREEVLAAQSADVSNVSGATYTTDAYLESLQAALDQAGF
ncbi:FMN-binding protein [Naasia lichenicola]|uniref:FMN-binding protein n=1 Tax=Naasia lichenicola TaxID=2565933 RepID=A0A4V3WSZ5_9MICO|nr:FMN-binding protein [Naasia lichenicola]THG30017.1 FMN-binding protein [Naasia lichenicola]